MIEIFGDLNRRIYLYGSDKKHDYLIEQDNMKPLCCILYPSSPIKNFWNIVIMVLLIYTGTYVPYAISFIQTTTVVDNWLELSIDSLFMFDVFINFISAYEDNDKNIEFRLNKIAWQYLTSWFIMDVLSSVPF